MSDTLNPYVDESWVGPNSTRDSEPCDQDCEPDEEHVSACIFWRTPMTLPLETGECQHLGCGPACRYEEVPF